MGKFGDNKPKFSFAKLVGANDCKKSAWEMCNSLKFVALWGYIFLYNKNLKPVANVFKSKDLETNVKLKQWE